MEDADYRRGYLCGMVRGDAHLGTYVYERAGRSHGTVHRFRLALADDEALERAAAYLATESISTKRFAFSAANAHAPGDERDPHLEGGGHRGDH